MGAAHKGDSEQTNPHLRTRDDLLRKNTFKVVLVGAAYVGKTSIVRRFVKDEFQEESNDTIGCAFEIKNVQLPGDEVVKSPFGMGG